jgi:chromosome segregation ATPase
LTSLFNQVQNKNMADEAQTKPMLESILHELREFRASVEKQFQDLDVRIDRIESEVKLTHSELFALRADFKESRGEFNEFRAQLKQPV